MTDRRVPHLAAWTASVGLTTVGLAACVGGDAPSGPPAPVTVVSAVALSVPSLKLLRGADAIVTAAVELTPGSPGPAPAVNWQSADTSVARVVDGRVYAWAAGSTNVTATAGGRSARVPVTVALPPTGEFHVTWRFANDVPDAIRSAATRAADRLSRMVVGDVPSVTTSLPEFCGGQGEETIDDVVVYVRVGTGPAGSAATGGPCKIIPDRVAPAGGQIVVPLASADLPSALLEDVMLHELGHVLGIGTMPRWTALLSGTTSGDPRFIGARASAAYGALGFSGTGVPVTTQEDGHTHWRGGGALRGEVMSPLGSVFSRLSVEALADLGYGVSMVAAEPWAPNGLR